MRKRLIFILCISLAAEAEAQTLSPASIGRTTTVYMSPQSKSLSYGVNNISLVSVAPPADSTTQILSAFTGSEKGDGLVIYPNPVSDNLWMNLQLQGEGTAVIFILDNTGKKIMEFKIASAAQRVTRQMDVSKLPAGIYLLSVVFTPSNGGGIQTLAKKFQVLR